MKKRVSQNLPSTLLLEHFYPTEHEMLLLFSCLSLRNFLVVFLIHCCTTHITKTVHLYDSSNISSSATHVIFHSYEALHGAATIHKTSEMTHTGLLLHLLFFHIAPKMHIRILLSNEQRASSSYCAITKVSFACITTGLINTLYMNSLVVLESRYDFKSLCTP